jgi:mono/diheme cytochrome c family protein
MYKRLLFFVLLFNACSIHALPLKLTDINNNTQQLDININSTGVKTLSVDENTYQGKVAFKAMPLMNITSKLPKAATLKFVASDGFSSLIPAETLFYSQATPYLAIEEPDWPKSLRGGKTAGPFYLIWENAKAGQIKQEQWPFQVTELVIQQDVKVQYKAIYPDYLSPKAQSGFELFIKNCFVCHQLNQIGDANIGPDLNQPMNPTDYFQAEALKKFIRNPRSVRQWKSMQMPTFNQETLSESDINALIQYLSEIKQLNRE